MKNHYLPFILCIDDDLEDLQMLQDAFNAIGATYAVKEARNGELALQMLNDMHHQQALPSLIVLDVNMPRVDGRETLMAIQKNKALSHLSVVIYTTSSSPMDKMFFSRHNVPFFTKPTSFSDMKTIAAAMLEHCKKQGFEKMIA